jgi:hypothetical protein
MTMLSAKVGIARQAGEAGPHAEAPPHGTAARQVHDSQQMTNSWPNDIRDDN